jgi:hypothetical protein
MDNHYHLLIETPKGNLSQGMRQLNGVYTQRFNQGHGRVGHVFQGRYKAIVVDRDSYLLELCRYVVLNPVRAGMVKQVGDYPWSSYLPMVGLAACPAWLDTDWLPGQFGKRRATIRRRYADFVAQGKNQPSPWTAVRGQALLGSDTFVEKMRPLLAGKGDLKEIPRAQRLLYRPPLEKLFAPVTQDDKRTRNQTICNAYLEFGYSMASIARHIGLHYSTVSKIIKGN